MTEQTEITEQTKEELWQETYNRPGFISGFDQRSSFVLIRVHLWLSFSDYYSHLY